MWVQSLRPLAVLVCGPARIVTIRAILAGCLVSSLLFTNGAMAQAQGLKTGANIEDPAAPFFIDLAAVWRSKAFW